MRWASRTFEKAGAPVSLGVLAATEWSGFRVRVVDADGKPTRHPVLLDRVGPGANPVRDRVVFMAGSAEGFIEASEDGGTRFVNLRDVEDEGTDREIENGPRVAEEGIAVEGLLPGAKYRLYIPGPPGTSVEAEAPTARGEIRAVEIRIPMRPVRCVLHFTVRGAVPAEWGEWVEPWKGPRLPASGWDGRGNLAGTVYPGTYLVQIRARATEKSPWDIVSGKVEVPAGDTFEASVDLRLNQ
jgi:hypothetical protein